MYFRCGKLGPFWGYRMAHQNQTKPQTQRTFFSRLDRVRDCSLANRGHHTTKLQPRATLNYRLQTAWCEMEESETRKKPWPWNKRLLAPPTNYTTQPNQTIIADRTSTNSSLSSPSLHPSAIRNSVLPTARCQLWSALNKKLPLARCSLGYFYTEQNQQSKSLHNAMKMNSTLENDIWCTFYQYKVVSAILSSPACSL